MEGLGNSLSLLGAALAVLMAGSGSAIGIGTACRSSCGVLTELPERYGLNFILVVLPGTQGIYGLVSALMLMFSMGLFSDFSVNLTVYQGLLMFAACLPVGIAGLISAMHQGRVCASAVNMAAKRPEMGFKAGAVYAVMVELYALFGMLVTILMIVKGVDWEAAKVAVESAVAL